MADEPDPQLPEPTRELPSRIYETQSTLPAPGSELSLAVTDLLGEAAAAALNRRYEVFREIARGAFGAVMHARE